MAVSHIVTDSSLAVQLILATNELIDAERNLGECYVADRDLAAVTFQTSSWPSMAQAERAIDIACAGIRNDISRLTATVLSLRIKVSTLQTLVIPHVYP